MTTVGYGEYHPQTRLGRWIASTAILAAFIIFPYHVQRLLSALHVSQPASRQISKIFLQIPPGVVGTMPSMSSDFIFIYGKIRPRQLALMIHNISTALTGSVRHILVVTPFPAVSFKSLASTFSRSRGIKICVSQKYPLPEELQTVSTEIVDCSLAVLRSCSSCDDHRGPSICRYS